MKIAMEIPYYVIYKKNKFKKKQTKNLENKTINFILFDFIVYASVIKINLKKNKQFTNHCFKKKNFYTLLTCLKGKLPYD